VKGCNVENDANQSLADELGGRRFQTNAYCQTVFSWFLYVPSRKLVIWPELMKCP